MEIFAVEEAEEQL